MSQVASREDWEYARDIKLPFKLVLESAAELHCDAVLRCLPGRRLVCRAWRDDKPVLVKLFLDSQREQEALVDAAGVEAMMAAGIRTPTLLSRERVVGKGYPLLLFTYLPDTSTFREDWEQASEKRQSTLIADLLRMVASQHQAGLRQRDFHLRNFLLDTEGKLYAIDGGDFLVSDKPVEREEALHNLGVLFGHLPHGVLLREPGLLQHYVNSRQWTPESDLWDRVFAVANRFRRRRAKLISRKAFRNCSEFKLWRKGSLHLYQRRDLDTAALQQWIQRSGLGLLPDEDVVLKPGNSQTVWQTRIGDMDVVVKRYNLKNWRHALRRAFSRSRASRSWENAHALRAYHIRTPEPLVMIERRIGPLRRQAWFITRQGKGIGAVRFLSEPQACDTDSLKAALANTVLAFGENALVHGDMKATNFLLSEQGVEVIDLDSMRQDVGQEEIARDRRRFLANWQEMPKLQQQFSDLLSSVQQNSGNADNQ